MALRDFDTFGFLTFSKYYITSEKGNKFKICMEHSYLVFSLIGLLETSVCLTAVNDVYIVGGGHVDLGRCVIVIIQLYNKTGAE